MVVMVRGGGDLASGVAVRLFRAGLEVIVTELARPLAIRRKVAFSEAVYTGSINVEEITGVRISNPSDIQAVKECLHAGQVPVVVDPKFKLWKLVPSEIIVDATMRKELIPNINLGGPLVIGLGPGFRAGYNCHAVVETNRGHTLGRVIWQGEGHPDSGVPDAVYGHTTDRVLRAPTNGTVEPLVQIGDHLTPGQFVATMNSTKVVTPIKGVLRGLIHPAVEVPKGVKIGDVDPRDNPKLSYLVSDKALAIGGGVLEAIMSVVKFRSGLWESRF